MTKQVPRGLYYSSQQDAHLQSLSHFDEQADSPTLSISLSSAGLGTPAPDTLPGLLPELYDNTEAERTLLQLGARWRQMTKQPGAALPPEAALVQQEQVRVAAPSILPHVRC